MIGGIAGNQWPRLLAPGHAFPADARREERRQVIVLGHVVPMAGEYVNRRIGDQIVSRVAVDTRCRHQGILRNVRSKSARRVLAALPVPVLQATVSSSASSLFPRLTNAGTRPASRVLDLDLFQTVASAVDRYLIVACDPGYTPVGGRSSNHITTAASGPGPARRAVHQIHP